MNFTTNNGAHEQARNLIALAGPESLSAADRTWLAAHLEACGSCRAFAESAAETIHELRAVPIAATRCLVSTTQLRVRRRALELQRHREHLWLVSVSCAVVTLCALLSTVALWRGFAWLGARAQLAPPVWQVAFLVFCVMPALIAALLLLATDKDKDKDKERNKDRDNYEHIADHSGSYPV